MCTVVVAYRPGHDWPILVAANRDEMKDRPWLPPARHWADRKQVVAGRDELAGGTWMGINDDGVFAAILNRRGSLGPDAEKRSRGEIVLEALDHETAEASAQALQNLDPSAYRSFNLIIADFEQAFWLKGDEGECAAVLAQKLEPGISMITHADLNDRQSARIGHHLDRFQFAPLPDLGTEPVFEDWFTWSTLLSDKKRYSDFTSAMNIETESGFGTVSHSLVSLPNLINAPERKPIWHFAEANQEYSQVQL